MKIDVPIHGVVRCDDGVARTSQAVIIDPMSRTITDVVVRDDPWPLYQLSYVPEHD